MTQEEKQLLLKDLCARLPYGLQIHIINDDYEAFQSGEFDNTLRYHHLEPFVCYRIEIKPYLRPLSSMTEEEYKEYDRATDLDVEDSSETLRENLKAKSRVRVSKWYHGTDWLNAHHFDYRGLIEKGLALEAPEGPKECTQRRTRGRTRNESK